MNLTIGALMKKMWIILKKKYRNLHRIFHSNFGKEYLKLNSKCSQKIIERIIFSANMVLHIYKYGFTTGFSFSCKENGSIKVKPIFNLLRKYLFKVTSEDNRTKLFSMLTLTILILYFSK